MARDAVLIIRLAGIGDVVMASTVARRLRHERSGARIVWLCGTTAAPLVERFEDVDEVIAIDERRLLRGGAVDRIAVLLPLWARLARERFSDAYLLHADARYRVLTAPLFGTRVISQRRDAFGAMNPVPGRYFGDEYARLVDGLAHRGPIVGHAPLARLRPATSPPAARADGRPRIALVPGGTRNVLRESVLKRWPVGHYASLARALAADGANVLLVGDSGDAWVLDHFAGVNITSHVGRASLSETLDLFASCDLVVSHDTGPMHVARLAGAPLLALFGPTMPSQFIVEDDRTTVLFGGAHLACRPCYDGREFADCHDNQCMSSIAVEVVHRTAASMLARSAVPSAATPAPARAPLPTRP